MGCKTAKTAAQAQAQRPWHQPGPGAVVAQAARALEHSPEAVPLWSTLPGTQREYVQNISMELARELI